MEIAKLTSKGQITIPKAVRAELGVDTGDKLIFIKYDNGFLVCNGANFNVSAAAEESVEPADFAAAEPAPVVRPERKPAPVYYEEEEEREEKPKKEKDKDKNKDKDKDKKKKKKKKK